MAHDTWGQIGADRKRVGDRGGGVAGSQRGEGPGLRSPGRRLGGGSLVGAVSAAWLARRRHASPTTDSTGGILSPTHPSGCRATQHKDHATGHRAVYVQPGRGCQIDYRLPDPPVKTSQREMVPDPLYSFRLVANSSLNLLFSGNYSVRLTAKTVADPVSLTSTNCYDADASSIHQRF